MKLPNNIFVVINWEDTSHIALERALQFALLKDVHILLFSVVFEPLDKLEGSLSAEHRNEVKASYSNEAKQTLEKLASKLDQQGIQCSVEVKWHHELEEAIEEAVALLKPDLVIKKISASSHSINPFAMPIDRHLLRCCSAPLLLITQANWQAGPITLAIDPSAYDEEHIALNHEIIAYGKLLKGVTKKEFNVVSSFCIPMVSPTISMYGVDYNIVHQDQFKVMHERLFELLKSDHIAQEQLHVVEGKSELAIPRFISNTHSGLLVLGTVGRAGISALFLGNTAEKILAEVNCEILALTPTHSTREMLP